MKFDQLTLVLLSKLLLFLPFVSLLVIDGSSLTATHIGLFTGALLAGVIFLFGVVPVIAIGYMYYLDTIINAIPTTPIEENI